MFLLCHTTGWYPLNQEITVDAGGWHNTRQNILGDGTAKGDKYPASTGQCIDPFSEAKMTLI